ncbi:nucleolysin TIA-1 isoform X4 [Podarcis lilfordi]|uniref:Nucleolysin TIA-1 isoform X4 n=1 Tax=Podarcis lilfordi TaxID=74358 RepID=A0AA35KSC5_9SAUR|nr:nucleolysin TIA-1 isoform X4 [Podarcis lilfordi]
MEDEMPKTLYVGNLSRDVTEALILQLFSQIGPCKNCKMIMDTAGNDPYCFVEFYEHRHAAAALAAMNGRKIMGKEVKVNWATTPSSQKKDTSNHFHVFVGDLSPEITTEDIKAAFAPFGRISDARVVKDMATGKSKGYGFVSFFNKWSLEDSDSVSGEEWVSLQEVRKPHHWPPSPPLALLYGRGPKVFPPEPLHRLSSLPSIVVTCRGLLKGSVCIWCSAANSLLMKLQELPESNSAFIFRGCPFGSSSVTSITRAGLGAPTIPCHSFLWGQTLANMVNSVQYSRTDRLPVCKPLTVCAPLPFQYRWKTSDPWRERTSSLAVCSASWTSNTRQTQSSAAWMGANYGVPPPPPPPPPPPQGQNGSVLTSQTGYRMAGFETQ